MARTNATNGTSAFPRALLIYSPRRKEKKNDRGDAGEIYEVGWVIMPKAWSEEVEVDNFP